MKYVKSFEDFLNEGVINENKNPEGDKKVESFVKRLANEWDIPIKDAINFVISSMKKIKTDE